MSEYSLEIENLTKIYNPNSKSEKKALNGVSLKVKKGSFFGLLGPNGAGKSTIINIMAGLVKKTSGKIKISNIDFDQNEIATKFKIGIVPQELVIDPFFTVRETLEIYAGYFGVKKADRRTDEIISALGLSDKSHARPRTLSGGMKRRLLVAKALVNNPEILVLDEPTAGVDVELRTQLWQYVKDLNNNGTTIILTTHYLEEAEELCDEIAVINKGNVIISDKKDNLMNILNEKELIISFDQNIELNNLSLPKNTKNSQKSQNSVSIIYDPNQNKISDILSQINQNNINITDLSTNQPDLEEVFRHLVNHKS